MIQWTSFEYGKQAKQFWFILDISNIQNIDVIKRERKVVSCKEIQGVQTCKHGCYRAIKLMMKLNNENERERGKECDKCVSLVILERWQRLIELNPKAIYRMRCGLVYVEVR